MWAPRCRLSPKRFVCSETVQASETASGSFEQVNGMQPGVFEGTYSFVTWYPNWSSPESKAFVKAYFEKYGAYSEAAGVHYIGIDYADTHHSRSQCRSVPAGAARARLCRGEKHSA